jgi:hypothetical protein
MSELGRFRSLSGCLYKKRLNVRDGAGNRHSRKDSNQSHKNKGHPEGWPVQVVALEAENLGKIQCHRLIRYRWPEALHIVLMCRWTKVLQQGKNSANHNLINPLSVYVVYALIWNFPAAFRNCCPVTVLEWNFGHVFSKPPVAKQKSLMFHRSRPLMI